MQVFFPELEFCTDNGAMIAFAAALRMQHESRITNHELLRGSGSFTVRPRWDLATQAAAS
jgi:N6-L-threonylcarbamoyladenine synthase